MAKPHRRIPEKRREYHGEKTAEALVNWLNAPHVEEPAKRRIQSVVGLYLQLLEHTRRMRDSTFLGEDGYQHESPTPDTRKRDELKRELEKALSYYRMIPSILLLGKRMIVVGWDPAPGSKMKRNQRKLSFEDYEALGIVGEDSPPGLQMGESGAIKNVLELIESGLILKVTRCRCGRFFFIKFSHQRFCSEKCRIVEFRNSDEARRKRNEYARKLYHLHKAGKVK